MPQPVTSDSSSPTVRLFTIDMPFRWLWRCRYLILALTAACCALAAYLAMGGGGMYTARMTVASIGQSSVSALAQLNQFSIFDGGRKVKKEDREFTEFETILHSLALAERLERKYGLVRVLFGSQWDASQGRWVPPEGWRHQLSVMLNRIRGRPDWLPPNVFDLAETLAQLKVTETKFSKSIFELSYARSDRDLALSVLEKAYAEAEIMQREERLQRAQQQVVYLREKIASTNVSEYQLALTDLLASQEKQLMLLASDMPMATMVLDPANAPRQPALPNPLIYAAVGAVAGAFFGVFVAWLVGIIRFGVQVLRDQKRQLARAT